MCKKNIYIDKITRKNQILPEYREPTSLENSTLGITESAQQAYDVKPTPYQRRGDIMATSHPR